MNKTILALLMCMLSLSAFCQSSGTFTIHSGAILEGSVPALVNPHAEYTLYIIDEEGEEVYEVFIPENTSTLTLPLNLSGEYEL